MYIYVNIHILYIYISIYLSVCLSIYLSFYLSIESLSMEVLARPNMACGATSFALYNKYGVVKLSNQIYFFWNGTTWKLKNVWFGELFSTKVTTFVWGYDIYIYTVNFFQGACIRSTIVSAMKLPNSFVKALRWQGLTRVFF